MLFCRLTLVFLTLIGVSSQDLTATYLRPVEDEEGFFSRFIEHPADFASSDLKKLLNKTSYIASYPACYHEDEDVKQLNLHSSYFLVKFKRSLLLEQIYYFIISTKHDLNKAHLQELDSDLFQVKLEEKKVDSSSTRLHYSISFSPALNQPSSIYVRYFDEKAYKAMSRPAKRKANAELTEQFVSEIAKRDSGDLTENAKIALLYQKQLEEKAMQKTFETKSLIEESISEQQSLGQTSASNQLTPLFRKHSQIIRLRPAHAKTIFFDKSTVPTGDKTHDGSFDQKKANDQKSETPLRSQITRRNTMVTFPTKPLEIETKKGECEKPSASSAPSLVQVSPQKIKKEDKQESSFKSKNFGLESSESSPTQGRLNKKGPNHK